MARLTWDRRKDRIYETGASHCVLYVRNDEGGYEHGVAWSGLISITEQSSGAEPSAIYADDKKYVVLYSTEELSVTLEAYQSPPEFKACDGSIELTEGASIARQHKKTFALCYKTIMGNAMEGTDFGYKLHIIYGCTAHPSEKAYNTIADTTEPVTFSWEIDSSPILVNGYRLTSLVTLDSTLVPSDAMAEIEGWLYGSEDNDPTLINVEDMIEIINDCSDHLYTYEDPEDDGHVYIICKAKRRPTYSYHEDSDGNVVIEPIVLPQSYSYTDANDSGDVVIEEVT